MSNFKRLYQTALSLLLIAALVWPAVASAEQAESRSSLLKTVYLTSRSYLQIKDVRLLPGGSNTVTAFTVTWHNGDTQKMDLHNYFIQVKSAFGINAAARVLPKEDDSVELGPNSEVTYHYYAKTGTNTKLTDLYLDVMKWNFASADFQQSVEKVSIPAGYSAAAPSGAAQTMFADGNRYEINVKSAGATSNDTYWFPVITLAVTNRENASLSMPNVEFHLRTEKGLLYPLEQSNASAVKLKPLEQRDLVLSGSIPASVGTASWELVAVEKEQASASDTFDYPVAALQVVPSLLEQNEINQTHVYQNDDGAYTLRLDHVYRMPWEDDDILSADVTILNDSGQSLPVLELTGSFLLDGRVKAEASFVVLDKMISIQPGGQEHARLVGKIPYTSAFDKLSVRLGSADQSIDVVEFGPVAEPDQIPALAETESHQYAGVGNQIELKVREASTFTGASSDIYMAQMDLTNLEKRITEAPVLSGHFEAADGTVLPAAMEKADEKSMPGGKAVLQAWTTIPKGFDTKGMRLIIGKSLTGGQLSGSGSVPDAYVDPVEFSLPAEPAQAQTDLKNMSIGPYSLTISDYTQPFFLYNRTAGAYQLTFRFDYELTQDFLTRADLSNHRFLLEIEDGNDEVLVSAPFRFSQEQGDASGAVFDMGANKYEWEQNMNNASFNSSSYTLKVYDLFHSGYKKLLAAQSLN